jgi:hypothetical protein
MSLDESYPGIQPTTGRKAGDLLTFTQNRGKKVWRASGTDLEHRLKLDATIMIIEDGTPGFAHRESRSRV